MKLSEIEQICADRGYEFMSNKTDKRITLAECRNALKQYEDARQKEENDTKIRLRKEQMNDPNREPFSPVRFENSPIQQKFKNTIDIMRDHKNHNIMQQCYYEICKICKIYPPRKNENKMVYGKLAEIAIANVLCKMNIDCINLDKLCNIGSEYKNDFKIGEFMVSLKTKKMKKSGDIILINTHSTSDHGDNLEIDLLLCIIEDGKLYFIPHDIIDESIFIKHNPGNIAYANSVLKYMDDLYSDFIYTFPKLSEIQKDEISKMTEVDLIHKLYTETIQSL
jgi:hypothetical protein